MTSGPPLPKMDTKKLLKWMLESQQEQAAQQRQQQAQMQQMPSQQQLQMTQHQEQ